MLTVLLVTLALAWLAILALGLAMLALARQVGVLHMRVAPAGALTTSGGPAVGDPSPVIAATTLNGEQITVGGSWPRSEMRLLMFVSAACPLCKALIPIARSFAREERLQLVFVGDDTVAAQRALIAQHGLGGFPFVNGPEVGQAFAVGKLPYAVLLDRDGAVLSKGLVNSREHLESLVIAHEMGVRSVQDYIGQRAAKVA